MTVVAKSLARRLSERMQAALELPSGARFYRCALQINPFAYLKRHNKQTAFASEGEYNRAIVSACLENGIEVIGVTDHYRAQESASLVHVAREAGLFAFFGFEAVAKDGVHFLCLFDPDKDTVALERFIGECGIHDASEVSPTGNLDYRRLENELAADQVFELESDFRFSSFDDALETLDENFCAARLVAPVDVAYADSQALG